MQPFRLVQRLCLSAISGVVLLGFAPRAHADPTAEEQYWLELVNQARRDPAGELERLVNYSTPTTFASPASDNPDIAASLAAFGTSASDLAAQWASLVAAPALAWSDSLRSSALNYSNLMISTDQQSHLLDGSGTVGDRVAQRIFNGGYYTNTLNPEYLDLGENLYASARSTLHAQAGFMIDWGDSDNNSANGFGNGIQSPASHRELLMDPHFKQIGIGDVRTGIPGTNATATGPVVVTQHLGNLYRTVGNTSVSDAILTGVVYSDNVLANNFYTPGEGMAGRTIEVFDNTTNALLFTGSTNTAGGFNIPLPGVVTGETLRISALGIGLPDQLYTVSGFVEPTITYGAPVTFYDNLYSSFQVVPEPGSILLVSSALSLVACRRRRTTSPLIEQIVHSRVLSTPVSSGLALR
jgi:uncharacterized protein YkwD